ncbi:hypothetical protein AHAS_Ahas10G0120900 [Arachis hypogaea]
MKQSTIRGEVLQGIEEAMRRGDDEASSIGTRIILPSSFTSGRRYRFNRCRDAMAICKHYFGYPNLFLTITCNPNWLEFQRFTERERIPIADCVDISCRVFHTKLKCLLSDLKEGVFFGPVNAEACSAMRFLIDDKEYVFAIKEVTELASATQLRRFFVMLLLSGSMGRPLSVWEQTWAYLSNDILYRRRHELQYPVSQFSNLMLLHELQYDTVSLSREHDANILKLNEEQRVVYDKIIDCVSNKRHGFFFAYGFGGTGKTFLYRVLSTRLRSEKNIIINVASSGIASLLLPGGKTAHSMFNIPVELTEDTVCQIKKDSPKAEVFRLADLIIWDEAPMTNKLAFEALDRTLCDIMVSVSDRNKDLPFGGKVVILGVILGRSCQLFQKVRVMRL